MQSSSEILEEKSAGCEKWHVYRPEHTYSRGIILEGKLYRESFGASAEFSSMLGCIKNPDNNEHFGMIDGHENRTVNFTDGFEFLKGIGAEIVLLETH